VRRFEWRVGPMCRADCGQWWPAKLCVQLGRSKSVSAPRGPLRAAMSGVVCRAIARARGFPAGPARAPGRVRGKGGPRARGCGSVRGGLGSASCRPPVLGRLGSSPARSRRPFHRGLLRVGVRVGLLVPKATEGLFKLDAGFAPAARSAVAETESWGLLASESIQRPVPVQPQVPKPRRCASTPTRLIELAPSGTSRDGRVTRVVRVSAGHIGRCRVCSVRCRRVLSPTSPPQDGSGRRRALHMPNSVVRCAKRRAGPNSGTSTR
jgi:hypothetical protein